MQYKYVIMIIFWRAFSKFTKHMSQKDGCFWFILNAVCECEKKWYLKLLSFVLLWRVEGGGHARPITGKRPNYSNVWRNRQWQQCVLSHSWICTLFLCSCTKWWVLWLYMNIQNILIWAFYILMGLWAKYISLSDVFQTTHFCPVSVSPLNVTIWGWALS